MEWRMEPQSRPEPPSELTTYRLSEVERRVQRLENAMIGVLVFIAAAVALALLASVGLGK